MDSLVSVIIPAFNAEKYIKASIDSILMQTFKDFEIIVVDDGSTDNTKQILMPYIKESLVRYVYQENKGPGAARNSGIRASRGKFVCFLDADDLLLPGCLSRSVIVFEAISEIGVVFHNNYKVYMGQPITSALIGHWDESGLWDMLNKSGGLVALDITDVWLAEDAYMALLLSNFPEMNGTTVPRKLLLDLDGFDEAMDMGEDRDLWLRIAMNSQVGIVKTPGAVYRRRPGSLVEREEVYLMSRVKNPERHYCPERLNTRQIKVFRRNQRKHYYSYAIYLFRENRQKEAMQALVDCWNSVGWDKHHIFLFLLFMCPTACVDAFRVVKRRVFG